MENCSGPSSYKEYKLTRNRDLILLGDEHDRLGNPRSKIPISLYLMIRLDIQNAEYSNKPLKVFAELHKPGNSEYKDSPNKELDKLSDFFYNPEYKKFVDEKLFSNVNDSRTRYLEKYNEEINDIEEEYNKQKHQRKKKRTLKNGNNNRNNKTRKNKEQSGNNKEQLLQRLIELNKQYHRQIMDVFASNKDISDLIMEDQEYIDTVEEFLKDIFDDGNFEFTDEDFNNLHTLFAKVSGPLVEFKILEELKNLPENYTCVVYVGDKHKENLDKYFATFGEEPINI